MKRQVINVSTVLFPSVFMVLISVLSFTNILPLSNIDLKGLFVISLVLLFPVLFLIQGILCALNGTNVWLSFVMSVITFIVLLMIYLNSSAMIYILIYLISGLIGYGMVKLFSRIYAQNS